MKIKFFIPNLLLALFFTWTFIIGNAESRGDASGYSKNHSNKKLKKLYKRNTEEKLAARKARRRSSRKKKELLKKVSEKKRIT